MTAAERLRHPTARVAKLTSLVLTPLLLFACGGDDDGMEGMEGMDGTGDAQSMERVEYDFVGTVERVNTQAGLVAVANEDIPGWMAPMTMNYQLEDPSLMETLEPGDRIRAKVYTADFRNLYQVEIVQDEEP